MPSKTSDLNHYKRGSIIRIELDNFMIYKHVELNPGPFLNLVLGPNGSGKSAIVCSIIMGFGGDPQITGRSSNLIDYVRFGSQSALITIEVFSGEANEPNYIIQRELRIVNKNGKNECMNIWKLNNKVVTKAVISEFIRNINIDINNLCQILPQERVVEFARMSPKQLLVSTEKSIGNVDMYDQHMKLISLSSEITQIQQKIKDCNSFILKYQNFKSNIEPDLKLIKQKKKFEEEIEWLIKKQAWLEYEVKKLHYVTMKTDYSTKKKDYLEFVEKLKPIKLKIEQSETFIKNLKNQKNKTNDDIRKLNSKIANIFKEQENCQDKINNLISSYNEKEFEQKRIKSRLTQCEQDLNNYKNDLLNYSDQDAFNEKLAALKKELDEIENSKKQIGLDIISNKMKLESSYSEKRILDNKKKSINNLFNARIEKISGHLNDSHVKTACEWLENNRDNFKGQVFPPIITQINVIRQEWIAYVENAIGVTDMSTFLFEEKEDLLYFVDQLEKSHGIRVNVAMVPQNFNISNCNRAFDLKKYESFGIFASVRDLFTAPDPVMSYLCKNYHIHQTPVGKDSTDDHIQDLINSSSFRRIISLKNSYNIIVSTYDNEKTTRIVPLNKPKYLNIIIDENEANKVEDSLNKIDSSINEVKVFLDELSEKNDKIQELLINKQTEYNSFESKKNAISLIETKIKEKERQIKSIENSLISMDKYKHEIKLKLNKIQTDQLEILKKLSTLTNQRVVHNKSQIVGQFKIQVITNLKFMYEKNHSSLGVDEKNKRIELESLSETLKALLNEAKEFREKAKNLSGFDLNENVDRDILDKFNNLPATVGETTDAIDMLKLRCEGIRNIDESILEEYQKYQHEISQKSTYCSQLEKELNTKENEINSIKPSWIDSLNSLIEKINNNFSDFMQYLNFSGEVYLYTGNKEFAFEDYGIRIKVKFRDSEPMKDLDAYHQSGGERSVSTMIYMLSLQELANVPFRVVDEINQGMDETNERCVFDLIAKVSRKNSSQYFLLSPKLLNNLNYTEEMKVHIIFNGPQVCVNWNQVLENLLNQD